MEKKLPSDPQIPGKSDGKKDLEISASPKPLSLTEKLKAFDPAKHGGEHMPVKPVSQEIIPR